MNETDRRVLHTDIPARMDALPFSRWHWMVVIALGITWVLDGLEVTLAGSVGAMLENPHTLRLTASQVGFSATCYLMGAVAGAILFGWATDRFGRKKLFFLTLALYVAAAAGTAISWSAWSYFFFRALTGAGIGGEYSAINSAIDELIPARVRGQADLAINSTFWLGAALGAGAGIYLFNPAHVAINLGWRFAFGIGAALGIVILFLRKAVPESPRWLMIHGRQAEAEEIISVVEKKVGHKNSEAGELKKTTIHPRRHTPWKQVFHSMLVDHRKRSILGLALMIAQAFFYNAIFFTYALVLTKFYGVRAESVGLYVLPFAAGNLFGPILLGRLFDSVGRKTMISATYGLAGILLAITGFLFQQGLLTALTQTLCWSGIFFIASCAASSAYLTVSEVFPLELRAIAIAIFYAIGTLMGGVAAPSIFGKLIETGSRTNLLYGYLAGAFLMLTAAGVTVFYGVNAERQSLEDIAAPLSSEG